MRSYKAARRAATLEPVRFDYTYEVETNADDGGVVVEERTETFECRGDVSSLLVSELAANSDVDTADPEAVRLIRDFFAQAFGDKAEYQRFFRLHTEHGDDELLMEILGGLMEDFAGRPTMRPSDSPDTPSDAGEPLRVVSLSAGTVRIEQAASSA